MKFPQRELHVYTYVMKALILVVILLGSVRVMGLGVAVILPVTEVGCCRILS